MLLPNDKHLLHQVVVMSQKKGEQVDKLSAEQQAEAWDDLKRSMKGLIDIAPEMYDAIAGKDIEKIEQLEKTANDATSGFKDLQDQATAFTRSLRSDAPDLETQLKSLDDMALAAKNSADSYNLLNEDSEQATKVLEYLQKVTESTGQTFNEYKESVEALVEEMRALERQQTIINALEGASTNVLKAQLAVDQKRHEISVKEQQMKSMDKKSVEYARAEQVAKILEMELAILEAKKQATLLTVDSGAGQTAAIFGSEAFKDLKEDGKKFSAMSMALSPMIESLRSMGPEGEAMATAMDGFLGLATLLEEQFGPDGQLANIEKIGDMTKESWATTFSTIAAGIGAMSAVMNAATKQRVAKIDKEIEAEKKRDGKSKESVARIKNLEKKKEEIERKAFERDKKMKMAQVVMSTAAAIMQTLASGGWLMIPMIGMIAAIGAMQLSVISGMQYQGGGGSADGGVPSTASVGKRKSSVDLAKSQSAAGELSYMRGASGIGGPENFQGAFYGKEHRAEGGSVGYVVGEQGPELFMPEQPGTIIPNDDIGGMATNTNVTFNISTIDAVGVEDVLTEQQGNIIGMIRSAANEYGDPFLENVDTSIYSAPFAGYRRA